MSRRVCRIFAVIVALSALVLPADAQRPNDAAALAQALKRAATEGRYTEAERIQRQILDLAERASGANHPNYAYQVVTLSTATFLNGKAQETEQLLKQALGIYERAGTRYNLEIADTLRRLAKYYYEVMGPSGRGGAVAATLPVHRRNIRSGTSSRFDLPERIGDLL